MAGLRNDIIHGEGLDLTNNRPNISNQLGTDGFIYLGNSSGRPQAALPTSSDSTITWTAGSGTLSAQVDITNIPTVATSYTTDSGSAVPSSGVLTVSGGTGMDTSGAGSTLTVTLETPVVVSNGGTGVSTFTTGSVIFMGTSTLTEDNSNLFWDNNNNRLGIGTASPLHDLEVQGHVGIERTADAIDLHAVEIISDAAGFGDFKALDIIYTSGALSAGEEDAIILVNIDESAAGGGEIFGLEVLSTTEGTDVVGGLKVGIGVNAVNQESGTFGDLDEILNIAADVTAALANGGAGNITMFVADDDTITMGDAAIWDETEVILDTPASGGGIQPVFAFSTGGAGFTNFVPVDGTNGFRNTGVIDWDSGDLSGWATNASGRFEIRVTRTRNSLSTSPIVDEIQRGATTAFVWDSSGDVNLNSLTLVTDLAVAHGGTGLSTITDGGVMLGSGTGAVTPLGQATNGQLVIGSTSSDPVLASILSADASVTITAGAGSIDLAITSATFAAFNWAVETGATRALTVNQGVFGNRGTAQTFTLPTTAAVGDTICVTQMGAGLITIDYDTNEFIQFGNLTSTTSSGSIVSTAVGDSVCLVCNLANTSWFVINNEGNWTVN